MNQQYSIQIYLSSLIEIEQEMQKELALRQRMTGDALILIRLIISQECCTCISDAEFYRNRARNVESTGKTSIYAIR